MSSLRNVQARFRAAIFRRDDALVASAIVSGDPGIPWRLDVYRRNAFGNLADALAAIYPVVRKLVGAEFFRHATGEFIARTPSRSGDLNDYGADFPGFLAGYAPVAGLPYLPDTARLEWLVHEAYFAADRPAVLPATSSPEELATWRLQLHPTVRRFESPYPVHRIWQVNQDGGDDDATVNLDEGGARLLIHRAAGEVVIEPLDIGVWTLLDAIAAGRTVADACAAALRAAPSNDLAAFLPHLLRAGIAAAIPPH